MIPGDAQRESTPMQDLDGLIDQMGRAADKLFDRTWLHHFSHICWEPEVNVYECQDTLVFLVNLPGVSRSRSPSTWSRTP